MTADQFTRDVLREGLNAITEEMFVSLQRDIAEPDHLRGTGLRRGLVHAAGDLVSQGNGIAGFSRRSAM